MLMASKFTEPVRAAFLEALSHLGEWKAAAATVGVTYQCVYERRTKDPLFEEQCNAAMGRLDAELMKVARDLAIKGRLVETHDKDGRVIRTEHKISDRLLHAWLKRRMPQEWGDKVQVDQNVTANVTHQVQAKDLTREQRNRVRDLLDTLPTDN